MRRPHWSEKRLPSGGVLLLGCLLGGCGNMSGLGGSEQFGCKAPAGVQCQSVSGTYFSGVRGTKRLPSAGGNAGRLQPAALSKVAFEARSAATMPASGQETGGYAPLPLHSPMRIVRLWIKPWEDADHDLVDQSYVYVRVDQGKWMLDHVQQQVRQAYAPLRPPAKDQAVPTPTSVAAPAAQPGLTPLGSGVPLQAVESPTGSGGMGGR
jgi:conjugal transfer pilus assembly protein TraV